MLGLWFLFVGVGFVVPVCRCWVCGSCLYMLGLWFLFVDVGFGLRKDDAASLKEMIVTIQTKAAAADKTLSCDK